MEDLPKKDATPKSANPRIALRLTKKQDKALKFFLSAPLRSADRLMKHLYKDDHFYETATYAWVSEADAKKLFLYGICKEVLKICIALMNDKEVLEETLGGDPDRTGKIVIGSITDSQTFRIRKMIELLSLLILFDRNTKDDKEYRVFLSAENLDLALSRQEDFRELYEARVISNAQHSIDDFKKRIEEDLKKLGVTELWFIDTKKLAQQKPSVFRRKKTLYLEALMVASADERMALGISYGRGYSRTSRSIHPLIGSHDYGKDDNSLEHIVGNFSYLSTITMHVMNLAYKIAGIEDPEGIKKLMGENFEKSVAAKQISSFSKELQIGDLVLTRWTDLVEIVEEHTSKYGYKAYKVRYLSRPPLPQYPEDWMEAQSILTRIMPRGMARSFLESNAKRGKLPKEVAEIWPEVMKQSDDILMESVKGTFVELHNMGALIPMLIDSGFLKPTERQSSFEEKESTEVK
jgi:hypothetical protein